MNETPKELISQAEFIRRYNAQYADNPEFIPISWSQMRNAKSRGKIKLTGRDGSVFIDWEKYKNFRFKRNKRPYYTEKD